MTKPSEPEAPQERGGETAWLIEETWSGFIHYVHREFDAAAWVAERESLDRLPFAWIPTGTGGATLSRRQSTIPFITKNDNEAMRFESIAAAEGWDADHAVASAFTHGTRRHGQVQQESLEDPEP